jgi:hypothetical protein
MFNFFKSKHKSDSRKSDHGETYADLRNLAFNCTPDKIGVTLDKDDQVYGAIVDMAISDDRIATMVLFIDGSASLYFSNGGGIIGSGQHDSVKKIVGSFLISVNQVLPIMRFTKDFNVKPKNNHHVFYLFTRVGIYTYDMDINKYKESKETNFLFSISQMVLTEIRKTNEENKR